MTMIGLVYLILPHILINFDRPFHRIYTFCIGL